MTARHGRPGLAPTVDERRDSLDALVRGMGAASEDLTDRTDGQAGA